MPKMATSVFLLAHQDDESGCFHLIEDRNRHGDEIIIFYLTSGTPDGSNSFKRNLESTKVLLELDVQEKNIIFISRNTYSPDGRLPENLNSVFNKIVNILQKKPNLESLYFTAWEGGHQDHDAAHLIGVALAKKFNIVRASYQFPLYTGIGLRGTFFRLFKPIPSNGKPSFLNIPWSDRIKFLSLSLSYPSQIKTWIGLFPFFLFHYIFFGTQILQPVSLLRVRERPHNGKLFYERRFSYEYKIFKKQTSKFINKYI
jgi:hypothetical protein